MPARLAVALFVPLTLLACGGGGEPAPGGSATTTGAAAAAPDDPGPLHVHGLGAAPDGGLYAATHTGLFRVVDGGLERIGETVQDLMGFTVADDGTLLASGHGDVPNLGLVRSTDGGETWEPVSLSGEADFHALRAYGDRLYGFDASNARLLASADGGATWEERELPGMLADLVAHPADPTRLLAAGERGIVLSRDGGRSWSVLEQRIGLLAWPEGGPVYLVDAEGAIHTSPDGRRWRRVGETGEPPAALAATGPAELWFAGHDGVILRSGDGGRTWTPVASF
jgi:photosystem II stability/assembly factor-like uncharacterized protein